MTPWPPEHPGQLLSRVLAAMGMSQVELARRVGLTTKHVNQVIKGKAGISATSAVRLEQITSVPAEKWMTAQMLHDLAVAREAERDRGDLDEQRRAAARAAADSLTTSPPSPARTT